MTAFGVPPKLWLASQLRQLISLHLIKETECIPPRYKNHFYQRRRYFSSIKGQASVKAKCSLTPSPCSSYSYRLFNNGPKKEITESTILFQEGHEIQEVPVAVLTSRTGPLDLDECSKSNASFKSYKELDPAEEAAFVEGFNSYHTPKEVLEILDTIPSQEVTPLVAFSVIKKLFELESNFGFRNGGKSWVVSMENGQHETFARAAIIGRLIDTIISSDSTPVVLDTLDILRFEKNPALYSESEEFVNYRSRLCDNILVRVTEGKLPLLDTCRAVCLLGEMEKQEFFRVDKKLIDKMWVGILDRRNEITVSNIVEVFKTLQYFTKSQRLVFNLVENNLMTLWWRMDSSAAAQICEVIGSSGKASEAWGWCISGKMLKALSRCTSLNIHQITEDQLIQILKCFYHQNFCDHSIQKALSKYMKAKSSKITNPELIAVVADYARLFRLRDPCILEGLSEYLILRQGVGLSPLHISAIITCFGHLNFQPPNGIVFWEAMEKLLDDKFAQFTPQDILDILLACVYLGKYPLNFVSRVFSPYFLDRINSSQTTYSDTQSVRGRLKLLDASLNLECGWKYGGPLLPKDFSAKSFFADGRILRTISVIKELTLELCGQSCSVESSYALPSMPFHELYLVDVTVIPMKGTDSQLYNYLRNRVSLARESLVPPRSDVMCFLIHIPEHFSADGNFLTGPQAMRIRHLKALGFSVVSLKYETVIDLRRQPHALSELLRQHLTNLKFPGLEN